VVHLLSASSGETLLVACWNDPDFDTNKKLCYARVIEIPTPSWLAVDAKFFKVNVPKEAKMIIQERAYSSPIWYTP
jgi:uncharacterized protein DUF3604